MADPRIKRYLYQPLATAPLDPPVLHIFGAGLAIDQVLTHTSRDRPAPLASRSRTRKGLDFKLPPAPAAEYRHATQRRSGDTPLGLLARSEMVALLENALVIARQLAQSAGAVRDTTTQSRCSGK